MQHDHAQHRWSAALVPALFPSLSLLHIMLLQMQVPFAVGVSLTAGMHSADEETHLYNFLCLLQHSTSNVALLGRDRCAAG
jgi:hypothetical protein